MKKTEIIFVRLSIVALCLNLLFIFVEVAILTVLTLLILSFIYGYLGFALFNNIRFRKVFKKNSYQGISVLRILGAILTGLALGITVIGLMFKFQFWPGANLLLNVSLFGLLIITVIALFKYSKNKSIYYSKILKRIAIFGGLGLILLFIPNEVLLEIKFRKYPDYVEAVKKREADPDNKELVNKVIEEEQKMHKRYRK